MVQICQDFFKEMFWKGFVRVCLDFSVKDFMELLLLPVLVEALEVARSEMQGLTSPDNCLNCLSLCLY